MKKHIQTMMGATCSRPAARLVYVRDEYQTMANVRYLPGCTWLHRCSDDVGCCPDESKTCSPSHIESVSLPFFVSTSRNVSTSDTTAGTHVTQPATVISFWHSNNGRLLTRECHSSEIAVALLSPSDAFFVTGEMRRAICPFP